MSLSIFRERGYRITFYCEGYTTRRQCASGWQANWDQLIQYFGLDANPSSREILPLVNCPHCERPGDCLIIHPPEKNPHLPWRAWDWQNQERPSLTAAEQAYRDRMDKEFHINSAHAEAARAAAKAKFEAAQAEAKWRKTLEAARAKGIFLIGPANPWAHRKKGRWLG